MTWMNMTPSSRRRWLSRSSTRVGRPAIALSWSVRLGRHHRVEYGAFAHAALAGDRGDRVLARQPGRLARGDVGGEFARRGLLRGRGGAGDHQGDLAAHLGRGPFDELAELAAPDLLVCLGQLTADGGPPVSPERDGEVGEGGSEPVRCLEEHEGPAFG